MNERLTSMSTAPGEPLPPISQILKDLHEHCSQALTQTLTVEYSQQLADAYLFVSDLETWTGALSTHDDRRLFEYAAQEYLLSILGVCQGQYRNSFKSLRLVLELCLQGILLSTDLLSQSEWLKGELDTNWTRITDDQSGVLSKRFCSAFFPELSDNVPHFATLSKSLYRELSECIHGNVPIKIPLPTTLAFSEDAFLLWVEKTGTLRLVITFFLSMRYLRSLSQGHTIKLEPIIMQHLGHIAAIRTSFGGPVVT